MGRAAHRRGAGSDRQRRWRGLLARVLGGRRVRRPVLPGARPADRVRGRCPRHDHRARRRSPAGRDAGPRAVARGLGGRLRHRRRAPGPGARCRRDRPASPRRRAVSGAARDSADATPGAIGRPPALATEAMVATSQPTATAAGLRMLREGGNAADAALAAAAVLCVSEPMATGPGGDMFAIVFDRGNVEAIDGAGPSPGNPDGDLAPERYGPRSVDVPGAVSGWDLLARRHGRLGLEACLQDAISVARDGFAAGARCTGSWATSRNLPEGFGPAPRCGDLVRLPELG